MTAYAEIMLDDGLDGFPMTADEARRVKRVYGWVSREADTSSPSRRGQRIHGYWRRVADLIEGGSHTLQALGIRSGIPLNALEKTVCQMVAKGYLYIEDGRFFTTKRARREMRGGH